MGVDKPSAYSIVCMKIDTKALDLMHIQLPKVIKMSDLLRSRYLTSVSLMCIAFIAFIPVPATVWGNTDEVS